MRSSLIPEVAPLSWGYDPESTYPSSVYRYDYVLAADVVYHHDFLDELLVTMKHFCKPGTTLIWANKVRFESDLVFTENFKKAFHTSVDLASCTGNKTNPRLRTQTQFLLWLYEDCITLKASLILGDTVSNFVLRGNLK
uniref:Uncharacterized protein n=1 Tax=Poecilia latipinna TaxID=48699 RepID=A0A3B3U5P2_9TELE